MVVEDAIRDSRIQIAVRDSRIQIAARWPSASMGTGPCYAGPADQADQVRLLRAAHDPHNQTASYLYLFVPLHHAALHTDWAPVLPKSAIDKLGDIV